MAGISLRFYTEIEAGRKVPTVYKAISIAETLGQTVEDVFAV